MVFWSLWLLGPIFAQQTAKFQLASLDTPGDPGGIKVVELSAFENISAVLWQWRRPGGFFQNYENVAQCQFYKYGHQKSVFAGINSHNFNFSTERRSLKS